MQSALFLNDEGVVILDLNIPTWFWRYWRIDICKPSSQFYREGWHSFVSTPGLWAVSIGSTTPVADGQRESRICTVTLSGIFCKFSGRTVNAVMHPIYRPNVETQSHMRPITHDWTKVQSGNVETVQSVGGRFEGCSALWGYTSLHLQLKSPLNSL